MRTAQKVSSAAAKVLQSRNASKAEKIVAVAALTQSKVKKERPPMVLHLRFPIGSAHQEFHDDLAFLVKEWPWPHSKEEIVMRLVREEAKKMRTIQRAVAEHFEKKKGTKK